MRPTHASTVVGFTCLGLLFACGRSEPGDTSSDAGHADGGGQVDAGPGDGGMNDWSFYRYDLPGRSDVDVPFTTMQGRSLTNVWTYSDGSATYANPIVVDGVAYFSWSDGKLKAVSVKDGAELWRQPIGIVGPNGMTCVQDWSTPSGAAGVVGSTVFAPGGDGDVYAFDRISGAPLWKSPVAVLADNETLWTSIFPLNGTIYVGVATLDEDNCPNNADGRVVSLDQVSGEVTASWWVTNHVPGGGVWTQPAYDSESNRLFVATGNAVTPDMYSQAVVALAPDTLEVLDAYQLVASNPDEDYDFGASPTLIDLPGGEHIVAVTNKNGTVYGLDRDRLAQGPVWEYQICLPGTSPDQGTGSIVSGAYAHGAFFAAGGQTADGYPGAIAALDPSTGQEIWKVHPDGFVLPALLVVGDVLIAASSHLTAMTGRLYVLDAGTGDTLMTFPTAGQLFSPPSFAEGTLLVPDTVGNVYAFRSQ